MAKILPGDIPGNKFSHRLDIASRASNATSVSDMWFVAPYDLTIKAVKMTIKAALTGQATNYPTFALRNLGAAGAGTTDLASLAFSSTAVTASAKVSQALTLGDTVTVTAGDVLEARVDPTANGKISDITSIQFDYEWT